MRKSFIIPLVVCFFFCGCEKEESLVEITQGAKQIVLTRSQEESLSHVNTFSCRLFQEGWNLMPENNFILSPFSTAEVLAMLSEGADGQTQKEIVEALGFNDYSNEEIGSFFHRLRNEVKEADPTSSFMSSNAMWLSPSNKNSVNSSFINASNRFFETDFHYVDLSTKSGITEVNKWCYNSTGGTIPRMVDAPMSNSSFALTNAIYFSGVWKYPFPEEQREVFHHLDGKEEKVKMMKGTVIVQGARWDDCPSTFFSLPYGNGAFRMEFFVPMTGYYEEAITHISSVVLDSLRQVSVDAFLPIERELTMPFFEIQTSPDLKSMMADLGIRTLFSNQADLSKMSPLPVSMDAFFQKTLIKVDKRGTTASAVTETSGSYTFFDGEVPSNAFVLDRPFFFIISESSTGAILFIGQYV